MLKFTQFMGNFKFGKKDFARKTYEKMLKIYGPQGWWPIVLIAEDELEKKKIWEKHGIVYGISYYALEEYYTDFRDPFFEIAIGAILTQNTAWRNVAKAITNLYNARALKPKKILALSDEKLQKLIRPAGYFRQKAKKLKIFCRWIVDNCGGDIRCLKKIPVLKTRESLLSLWGIGKETADSILLYALNRPIFMIDIYTKRLCEKYGIIYKEYDDYRKLFEENLKKDTKLFQEYHALIVASGQDKHKKLD